MIVRSRLLFPVAALALAFAFAVPAAFADDMSKDSMSKDSGMKKDSMSKGQTVQRQHVQGQDVEGQYVEVRVPATMRRAAFRGPVHRVSPRCRNWGPPDDHRKPAPDCQPS